MGIGLFVYAGWEYRTMIAALERYNSIPSDLLKDGDILEFGPSSGIYQLVSKHRRFFESNNYIGIDIDPPERVYLDIIKGDMRSFIPHQEYKTVLAIHVLEHIDFIHWERVIDMLQSAVLPDGILIIGVPFNEKKETYDVPYHKVFNITPDIIKRFIPDIIVQRIPVLWPFHEDGANFLWCLFRYVYRRITRHNMMGKSNILAVWRRPP